MFDLLSFTSPDFLEKLFVGLHWDSHRWEHIRLGDIHRLTWLELWVSGSALSRDTCSGLAFLGAGLGLLRLMPLVFRGFERRFSYEAK